LKIPTVLALVGVVVVFTFNLRSQSMSKRSEIENEEAVQHLDDVEDDSEIEDGDVGFLIDGDGNLKSIFGAIDLFEDPPESILQILDIFGIDHIEFVKQNNTIH
jgi:hypothetical protein